MSVEVHQLSKFYGRQKAVDSVEFSLKMGEIVGFLGPNGAGKTTTMRMICGHLIPSEGHVRVCDYDPVQQPLEAKRKLGFLPENNPLYLDMYVREYLGLVASIHGISKPRERIEEIIQLTGLGLESHKLIGSLSKGYRQRVGLAQAMIHNPDVLILDEPTSGLDPNQLAEIRQLIKTIGKEKTVLFSSHIMQEVQALCDRVIIINRGKIVADAPIDQLELMIQGRGEVTVQFLSKIEPAKLKKIKGVSEVEHARDNTYQIVHEGGMDIREELFRLAVSEGWVIIELVARKHSVEAIFQQLTKAS